MKQLLILFLFFSFSVFSQNFEKVDAVVINYPRFSKAEDLANQIEKDFKTDVEKARAAFFWLTKNIRYNLKELYNPTKRSYRFKYSSEEDRIQKLQKIKDDLVADTFKNKTGVCEEYAQSFKKICDLLQIESEVIKGNVRTNAADIGEIATTTNHAWNAVKIDEKWLILDATWAAGYETNGKWIRKFDSYFFDIPKEKIFKTHYPEETIWKIRFGRMNPQDFYNQPIYSNAFLSLNAELLSPSSGIIHLKASENLVVKFKNLYSNLAISYAFKGMRYAEKPIISSEEKITTVTIKNPQRNTDLILYLQNEHALDFRVQIH